MTKESNTVLHLLSQRPTLTGSGITLDVLAREAAAAGWKQHASVGIPAEVPFPEIPPIPADRIHPLRFGTGPLPFPVPGMSDVMPYESTRFSAMSDEQWLQYRQAWRQHLEGFARRARPDVLHSHHVWLMSSLVPECFPDVPSVIHSHSTGLRQLELCPHRAEEIVRGVARNTAFVSLHGLQADQLVQVLGVPRDRVHVVGAGYREDIFHLRGREDNTTGHLLYVGKLSHSKGVPQLLDAVERLARRHDIHLHLAGGGAGQEADALRQRLAAMNSIATFHGQLDQESLAALMRRCEVLVLPSFYEGLPLVLVEGAACGCRVVSTALPGVVEQLAPHLGPALIPVAMPAMAGVDTPRPEALPAFVDRLAEAIGEALDQPSAANNPCADLKEFTWQAVFRRIEKVWKSLL